MARTASDAGCEIRAIGAFPIHPPKSREQCGPFFVRHSSQRCSHSRMQKHLHGYHDTATSLRKHRHCNVAFLPSPAKRMPESFHRSLLFPPHLLTPTPNRVDHETLVVSKLKQERSERFAVQVFVFRCAQTSQRHRIACAIFVTRSYSIQVLPTDQSPEDGTVISSVGARLQRLIGVRLCRSTWGL